MKISEIRASFTHFSRIRSKLSCANHLTLPSTLPSAVVASPPSAPPSVFAISVSSSPFLIHLAEKSTGINYGCKSIPKKKLICKSIPKKKFINHTGIQLPIDALGKFGKFGFGFGKFGFGKFGKFGFGKFGKFVKGRGGQNGNFTADGDAEGKKISSRSKGESFSVSKIWLWSKKGKFTSSSDTHMLNSSVNVGLPPWIDRTQQAT